MLIKVTECTIYDVMKRSEDMQMIKTTGKLKINCKNDAIEEKERRESNLQQSGGKSVCFDPEVWLQSNPD